MPGFQGQVYYGNATSMQYNIPFDAFFILYQIELGPLAKG